MKVITGTAKVKDNSNYIYKGKTLEITGVYIEYKNGNGYGIYPDGSREYRLSLIGTEFEKMYKGTVIHDQELENLVLYQKIILPLDTNETLQLIQFTKTCEPNLSDTEILDAFLESMKGPHTPPKKDPNSLYSDEEWKKNFDSNFKLNP